MERRVIVIAGPTASGKSEVAFRLAKKLNTGIVTADSRQIYRNIRIGTATPEAEKLSEIRYYLTALLDLKEEFNAARFSESAIKIIDELHRQNRIPIVEGGAGLYLRSLIDGIIDIPDDLTVQREEIKILIKEKGKNYIYELLKQEDPDAALRMLPQNWKRVMRALEVKRATGKSINWHYENQKRSDHYKFLQFGIRRNRSDLYARIEKRVDNMITSGLINEVRNLLAEGYNEELNALNTVGYKEVIQFLKNEISLERAVELIKRNSRRYAKRQLTWFNADERINWIDLKSDNEYDNAVNFIYNNVF